MQAKTVPNKAPGRQLKVVIVRDRASAGGGIYNYYQAVRPHLAVHCDFVDVGRSHAYYETSHHAGKWRQTTILRLLLDWCSLITQLVKFPDLVHINPGLDAKTRRSLRRDAANIWLAKLFRRPVLVFWRGWDKAASGTPDFPGGNKGLLWRTYQLADAHIVLASDFARDLRRWHFSGPIHVETTVVPDDVLEGAPKTRAPNPTEVNLLFLSRIEVAKGVFELLEVFHLLQRRHPSRYTLTFAGDGPCLQALKERVSALGISSVSFPGFVVGEKKIECYVDASIFCFLSSHGEGMPNAVLEAMAMGLPVVSSDAGGLKDILRDGATGYTVTLKSEARSGATFCPVEVADYIERITQSPELYRRISGHNRQYACQRFAAEQVAGRLEAIYRSMVERAERSSMQPPLNSIRPCEHGVQPSATASRPH